jgi:hypothetical protein
MKGLENKGTFLNLAHRLFFAKLSLHEKFEFGERL